MALQGNGMGAAWKRHAMCESALSLLKSDALSIHEFTDVLPS